MNINAVFSNLGAWKKINSDFHSQLAEIEAVLSTISIDSFLIPFNNNSSSSNTSPRYKLNTRALHEKIEYDFMETGWSSQNISVPSYSFLTDREEKSIKRSLDIHKYLIGIDLSFEKVQFLESKLFSDTPYFMQSHFIEVMVFIVLMRNREKNIIQPYSSFESVVARIRQIEPSVLRHPFVILGCSDQRTEINEAESTSEVDQYLHSRIGITLQEMVIRNEMDNYDFKISLPDNDKMAKEICAMANYPKGGVIIIGIDKQGATQGIKKGIELDQLQQRISGISHNSVTPRPQVQFRVFDLLNQPEKCILFVDVSEIENKPCMAHDRVYIRKGSTAVAAGPDEIRRLLSY